jgi:hypothetical protein
MSAQPATSRLPPASALTDEARGRLRQAIKRLADADAALAAIDAAREALGPKFGRAYDIQDTAKKALRDIATTRSNRLGYLLGQRDDDSPAEAELRGVIETQDRVIAGLINDRGLLDRERERRHQERDGARLGVKSAIGGVFEPMAEQFIQQITVLKTQIETLKAALRAMGTADSIRWDNANAYHPDMSLADSISKTVEALRTNADAPLPWNCVQES